MAQVRIYMRLRKRAATYTPAGFERAFLEVGELVDGQLPDPWTEGQPTAGTEMPAHAWLNADVRHASLFAEALETAYATLDGYKVRMLQQVVADGIGSDAPRLDVDQLITRALRQLEAGHIRVMQETTRLEEEMALLSAAGATIAELRERLPGLSDGLDALVAGLHGTGCLAPTTVTVYGTPPLVVTPFGERFLHFVRQAGEPPEDSPGLRVS